MKYDNTLTNRNINRVTDMIIKIIFENNKIFKHSAILLTALFMSNLSYAGSAHHPIDFPIPGSACQAYDEAALSANELIRTTSGIKNSGNRNINVYCPVRTKIDSTNNYITVSTFSANGNNIFECYLAFNEFSNRRYVKLTGTGYGSFGGFVATARFGWHPVTVKCTLKPGQQIFHIMSYTDKI